MFSLLGVSRDAVERLREKHHIYMTSDSRMNLAGILPDNVAYVAEAFAAESREAKKIQGMEATVP
jgi:aspartate/tyrosine/aromatic aminotransferase